MTTPQIPITGQVSSIFGRRTLGYHEGVDIGAPIGTPIVPITGGTVIQAGPAAGFGQSVTIKSPDGSTTVYGHVSKINVAVGDSVSQDTQIALSGNEGRSTGPHLHVEMRDGNGNLVNPASVLPQLGEKNSNVTQGQSPDGSKVTNPQVAGTHGSPNQPNPNTNVPTSPSTAPYNDIPATRNAAITGINTSATVLDDRVRAKTIIGLPETTITINSIEDLDKYLADNPLANYNVPAYHFELFVLPPISWNLTTEEILKNDNTSRLTIAESGVTGYNIKDVTIKNYLGRSGRGELTMGLEFEIQITEPAGVTLFDRLLNSTRQYGIPNLASAPTFLSLRFLGYDSNGDHEIVPNEQQMWRIQIKNIEVSYRSGAGEYRITAVDATNSSISDSTGIPKVSGNIVAKDIDQYLLGLQELLNKIAREDTIKISNTNIPIPSDEYNIVLNPIPVLKSPVDKALRFDDSIRIHQNTMGAFNINTDAGKTTFQFANAENIIRMIEIGLNSTVGIQKAVSRSQNSDTSGLPTDKDNENVFIYSIDTKVTYKTTPDDYDLIRNCYTKKVDIIISGALYPSSACIQYTNNQTGAESYNHPDDYLADDTAQKKRIARKVAYGFLAKRYDYLYTGLNTEVINLDLNFDGLWSAVVSSSFGNKGHNISQPGAIYVPGIYARSYVPATGTSDVVYGNKVVQAALKNAKSAADDAARQINSLGIGLNNSNMTDFPKVIFQQEAQKALAKISRQQLIDQSKNIKPGRIFIEEQTLDTVPPLPIQLAPSYISLAEVMTGVEQTGRRGISNVNTVMTQLSENNSMLNIDMTIRGDPYWLGTSRANADYYQRSIMTDVNSYNGIISNVDKKIQSTNIPHPKFDNGAYQFILMFRMPGDITNDDTLQVNLDYSPLITGVYTVTTVIHNFRNGVFTQQVQAIREYMTSLQAILPKSGFQNGTANTQIMAQ